MNSVRIALAAAALFASTALSLAPASAQEMRHCIRIGFSGNNGILTNLCSHYLYVTWYDGGGGRHVTAIGPTTLLDVGRVTGPFQIMSATFQ